MEEAIRIAASLCLYALRAGLSAGFATNMPLGEELSSTVFLPAPGSAREEEILEAMARLKLRCGQRFPLLLEDLADQKGLDILVLSAYDSDSIQAGIAKLRQNGNQVTLHLMEGGSQ